MALARRFGSFRSRGALPIRRTSSGIARRFGSFRTRSAGPGRTPPPTRAFGGRRPVSIVLQRRMARGGFFKSVFKAVKKVVSTVTKIPVIGTVAKAAVQSLPIVGQVTTAVNAFKRKTPVGAAASPVGGIAPPGPMGPGFNTAVNRPFMSGQARRPRRKAKRAKKAKAKRKGGGSAKQRAARARFAKAAKRGRIKKGQRL